MIRLFPCVVVLSVFIACQPVVDSDPPVTDTLVTELQSHFVPDRRVNRLDVEVSMQEDGSLLLTGETTLPAAKDSLFNALRAQGYDALEDQVLVMPSADLGEQTFALARHSVVNLRSEKGHSQELATQVLLGTPLRVLKQDEEWFFVQCPDQYLAWVHGGEITRITPAELETWQAADRVVYRNDNGYVYEGVSTNNNHVGDLVAGSILVRASELRGFTRVLYPDGRNGYVPSEELISFTDWLAERTLSLPLTKVVAIRQLGKPYFWGGTSPKAMDCSGFTKTVYWQQGLIIPRDASQQVHAGIDVAYDENLEGLEAGDFLFFGRFREDGSEKITHVGIYLGDGTFIHSGSDNGANKMQNLLPDKPEYAAHRRESLMRARRLQVGGPGVQAVADHPWYW